MSSLISLDDSDTKHEKKRSKNEAELFNKLSLSNSSRWKNLVQDIKPDSQIKLLEAEFISLEKTNVISIYGLILFSYF
jgi:hypothetical protein